MCGGRLEWFRALWRRSPCGLPCDASVQSGVPEERLARRCGWLSNRSNFRIAPRLQQPGLSRCIRHPQKRYKTTHREGRAVRNLPSSPLPPPPPRRESHGGTCSEDPDHPRALPPSRTHHATRLFAESQIHQLGPQLRMRPARRLRARDPGAVCGGARARTARGPHAPCSRRWP